MNVPLVFVAVITCLMSLYMMHRFIRRPEVVPVILLIIQLLAATVIIFSLLEDVLTTPVVELAVILTGVLLPAFVVTYDHIMVSKKRRKLGVCIPFIEKKEKNKPQNWNVSFFTERTELWKREIHALEVHHSLSIKDAVISENIKKQLILIQRLINLDNYEKAAEQYRLISSILPDSCAVAYNSGYLHCFVGKYREAYKILRRAYELVKQEKQWGKDFEEIDKSHKHYLPKELDTMIQFNMGFALYHMGKYEHAVRHFQKALDVKPDLTVAYKNIARAFLAVNMEDKAIEYLEKGRLDLRDSNMRVVLGSIYYRKGDTKKALEVLDEAAGADEKQIEAMKWRGKAAIKEKMYDKAIECFSILIRTDSAELTHYYHLALAQRTSGQNTEALKTYEKGINREPLNSMLLYHAGTLLDELDQKDKSVQYLYKSLQGNEIIEDALNYLGVLLGQMKRFRESVQVFEKGIKSFPNSYRLYFNRGIVLEMSRRLEDAVDSFEKAYELERKDPMLYYHYTAALIKIRDYTKAIRICKAGMSNYPEDTELIYGLSKVYAHMGEKDIAVDLLKKVLELDPVYLGRIRKDLDFKTLYRHPGYQSMMVS